MKTAVVLYGFLRSYRTTCMSMCKHVLDANPGSDLFIYTPSITGQLKKSNFMPGSMRDTQLGENVTEESLHQAYGDRLKAFELYLYDQNKFEAMAAEKEIPVLANLNPARVYSMFYHVARSLELVEKYEHENGFKYDTIILTRGDLAFYSPLVVEKMDLSEIQCPDGGGVIDSSCTKTFAKAPVFCFKNTLTGEMIEGNKHWIIDQIFIGQRDHIMPFKNIFSSLDEYFTNAVPCNPETIFHYYIKQVLGLDYNCDKNRWMFEIFRDDFKPVMTSYDFPDVNQIFKANKKILNPKLEKLTDSLGCTKEVTHLFKHWSRITSGSASFHSQIISVIAYAIRIPWAILCHTLSSRFRRPKNTP